MQTHQSSSCSCPTANVFKQKSRFEPFDQNILKFCKQFGKLGKSKQFWGYFRLCPIFVRVPFLTVAHFSSVSLFLGHTQKWATNENLTVKSAKKRDTDENRATDENGLLTKVTIALWVSLKKTSRQTYSLTFFTRLFK